MNEEELRRYLRALKPGERVVETTAGSMLHRRQGAVYISDTPGPSFGSICVRWDGPENLGTSVTGGTRRLTD